MSDNLRFGEILVRAGVLDRSALETVAREWESAGGDLGELLVRRGAVDDAIMLQTIGKALNLPTVSLEGIKPDPRALERVPRGVCEEHLLVPLEVERSKTGEHLHVAMANPTDIKAIKILTRESRLRIRPLVATARDIRAAIRRFYGGDAAQDALGIAATSMVEAVRPSPPQTSSAPRAVPAPAPTMGRAPVATAPTAGWSPPATAQMRPPAAPSQPPAAPAPSVSGPADALFDFGVMDLSAEPDPATEPPPIPRAPDLDDVLGSMESDDTVTTSDLGGAGSSSFGFVSATRRRSRGDEAAAEAERAAPAASRAPETQAARPVTGDPRRASNLPPLPPRPTNVARPEPQTPARPLPPLPPNLRGPSRSVELVPPSARGPELPPPLPGSEPEGLVDDREPLDVRRILDRFHEELGEASEPEDALIARHLEKYGRDRGRQSPDEVFEALDAALAHTRPGAGRLLVALIRHLARRGLVDPRELLAELQGE